MDDSEWERELLYHHIADDPKTMAMMKQLHDAIKEGNYTINELYTTGTGQELYVHTEDKCIGPCAIHYPTMGHTAAWPTHWRDDRGIMERLCPHNIGHPAVEQFGYWRRTGQEWQAVHGCDGCCLNAPGD